MITFSGFLRVPTLGMGRNRTVDDHHLRRDKHSPGQNQGISEHGYATALQEA